MQNVITWQWVATTLLGLMMAAMGYFVNDNKQRLLMIEARAYVLEDRVRATERQYAVADIHFTDIYRQLDRLEEQIRASRPTVFSSGASQRDPGPWKDR